MSSCMDSGAGMLASCLDSSLSYIAQQLARRQPPLAPCACEHAELPDGLSPLLLLKVGSICASCPSTCCQPLLLLLSQHMLLDLPDATQSPQDPANVAVGV